MATRKLSGALCIIAFGLLPFSAVRADTLISEILYDASGGDNGKVFVELSGMPGTALTGLSLLGINGADGTIYKTVALSGVIPADGFFVIADDDGSGATSVADTDLIAQIDFQNGPDSIVLRDGSTVIDAVGYGNFSGLFFAGEGTPATDALPGQSLTRVLPGLDTGNNGLDFVAAGPTPGYAAEISLPLPTAPALFLAGLSLLLSAGRRPRKKTQPDLRGVIC